MLTIDAHTTDTQDLFDQAIYEACYDGYRSAACVRACPLEAAQSTVPRSRQCHLYLSTGETAEERSK